MADVTVPQKAIEAAERAFVSAGTWAQARTHLREFLTTALKAALPSLIEQFAAGVAPDFTAAMAELDKQAREQGAAAERERIVARLVRCQSDLRAHGFPELAEWVAGLLEGGTDGQ